MADSYVIAIDLGGTNIKAGLVSESGEVEDFISDPSLASLGLRQSSGKLRAMIGKLARKQSGIRGIGIGIAGIVDVVNGVVTESPNFSGWKDISVKDIIDSEFDIPVFVDNDANVNALGEWWLGAGKGSSNMACLTLGTGVGGGLILNGRLFHGGQGMAGEAGHMAINPRGPKCGCGNRGCLEMYASSQGLARMVGDELRSCTDDSYRQKIKDVLKKEEIKGLAGLAAEGDELAITVFKRMGYYLGVGTASLNNLLNLELVVLSGGISNAFDLFKSSMQEEINSRCFEAPLGILRIRQGTLGGRAGVIGAAALAFDAVRTE